MIKHYAYLGHWVYYILGQVFICDIDGNIIDNYEADENTLNYFTDAKARINAHKEGLILLHGIIPDFSKKEAASKEAITPLAWQLLKEGNHPTLQGAK